MSWCSICHTLATKNVLRFNINKVLFMPRPLYDDIMFLTACDDDFILKCEWIHISDGSTKMYVECLPVENESTPWVMTQRVPHIIMCTQKKPFWILKI